MDAADGQDGGDGGFRAVGDYADMLFDVHPLLEKGSG